MLRIPLIQPTPPCELAAHLLARVLRQVRQKEEEKEEEEERGSLSLVNGEKEEDDGNEEGELEKERYGGVMVVDFCAGAGGPTMGIEAALNRKPTTNGAGVGGNGENDGDGKCVEFILTDLHPHLPAWRAAARSSPYIRYVPTPVDAAAAPADLDALAIPRRQHQTLFLSSASSTAIHSPGNNTRRKKQKKKKEFRLFALAFHHFPNALASCILRNTLNPSSSPSSSSSSTATAASADGFAILELQSRTFESVLMVLLLGPLLWAGSWYWFARRWNLLFWVYVLPVVPAVLVFDGVVSCLRTRDPGEMRALVRGVMDGGGEVDGFMSGDMARTTATEVERIEVERKKTKGAAEKLTGTICSKTWRFESGAVSHAWPLGEMSWFVGIRG